MEGIKAVAFDIDGTLYADWKLNIPISLYVCRHLSFFLCYSRVRKKLHRTAPLADFYEYQARLLAFAMKTTPEEAKKNIQQICYDGMKPYFRRIKPYRHAKECIEKLKEKGYKIGILSDFPPDQKGDIWGMMELCDVCIGSEESGALKPSLYPFGILAMKLGVRPGEVLYVGNSMRCDVHGALNAGMRSAYLLKGWRKIFNKPPKDVDICFKNYRQLLDIVLK